MKRAIITLILMLGAIFMFAQTGLYNLSFGDSYATAKNTLETNDYKYAETANHEGICSYRSETNDFVDVIMLYFDTEKDELVAWQIFYNEVEGEDMEANIVDAAEDWHGVEEYWDDYIYSWTWDLDEEKSLFIGYNWDDQLVAEYYNSLYPEYSELNY